jgi:hypothetical protein
VTLASGSPSHPARECSILRPEGRRAPTPPQERLRCGILLDPPRPCFLHSSSCFSPPSITSSISTRPSSSRHDSRPPTGAADVSKRHVGYLFICRRDHINSDLGNMRCADCRTPVQSGRIDTSINKYFRYFRHVCQSDVGAPVADETPRPGKWCTFQGAILASICASLPDVLYGGENAGQ